MFSAAATVAAKRCSEKAGVATTRVVTTGSAATGVHPDASGVKRARFEKSSIVHEKSTEAFSVCLRGAMWTGE